MSTCAAPDRPASRTEKISSRVGSSLPPLFSFQEALQLAFRDVPAAFRNFDRADLAAGDHAPEGAVRHVQEYSCLRDGICRRDPRLLGAIGRAEISLLHWVSCLSFVE